MSKKDRTVAIKGLSTYGKKTKPVQIPKSLASMPLFNRISYAVSQLNERDQKMLVDLGMKSLESKTLQTSPLMDWLQGSSPSSTAVKKSVWEPQKNDAASPSGQKAGGSGALAIAMLIIVILIIIAILWWLFGDAAKDLIDKLWDLIGELEDALGGFG